MAYKGVADRNLAPVAVTWEGMKTWDVEKPPFRLYGHCRAPGETDYKRLPHDLPGQIPSSPALACHYTNTAGLRLRFQTDSQKLILRCSWDVQAQFDHMPFTGASAFDVYADGEYMGVLRPGLRDGLRWVIAQDNGYESSLTFPDRKMRDVLVNFPLYNNVTALCIALEEDAQVLPGKPYTHTAPIVFGGSSITQGGCASHAGNSYEAILSRRLDSDYVNLGFSDSFRGEEPMARYIASLPMSLFVCDYDHNAPSLAHLEKTHAEFLRIFRESQPTTPVLMISTADQVYGKDTEPRKAVIRATVDNARAAGDRNVYFLDGQTIYRDVGYEYCTVDRCHPNDIGFWCMANAIEREIRSIMHW